MCTNNSCDGDASVTILRQIIWISRKHFQLNSALLEATGIGNGQVPVMMDLDRCGRMNQKELADRVHVTPATMSGILKRMERSGFIRRTTDENDARVSLVELTEFGRTQCETARRCFDQTCHQILDVLDVESQLQLSELLNRIQDNLGGIKRCRTESAKKE